MTQDGKSSRETYSIINISSVHESIPQPQSAHYAASKGGMEMLTKTVAVELADKGIKVNGIAPGAIATDMNKDILEDEQKKERGGEEDSHAQNWSTGRNSQGCSIFGLRCCQLYDRNNRIRGRRSDIVILSIIGH